MSKFIFMNFIIPLNERKKLFTSKIKALFTHNDMALSAIGSIEMILLLLVLVSLIVLFRTQITDIINTVFDKINDQINAF